MQSHSPSHLTPESPRDIFAAALRRTVTTSVAVLGGASVVLAWVAPAQVTATIWIGVASMVISAAALTPGMMIRTPGISVAGGKRTQVTAQLFLIGVTVAMGVRFAGTVALFVMCRYQFGLNQQNIALHVCGWYVLLTSLEIFFLARGASAIHSMVQTGTHEKIGIERNEAASERTPVSQITLTDSTIG